MGGRGSHPDGVVTRYPGDGIILATATGSTAYNLAAGGPIVVPPAACILARPLAPHTLGLRSVIFPPEERIRVRALSDVILIADGDRVGEGPAGTEIAVTRAEPPTRRISSASRYSPRFSTSSRRN